MRKSRILAASAALVLTMTGIFAPASHSAPISGRDWVATPNGLVGVQQMVIVRASGQAGAMAVVTFQNTSAGINAGQAAVNSQGFAYLPWQPGTPGAWNISATVGGSAVGTASIVVAAMPTTTTLLIPGQVRNGRTATIVAHVRSIGGEVIPSGTIAVRNQQSCCTKVAHGGNWWLCVQMSAGGRQRCGSEPASGLMITKLPEVDAK